MLCGRPRAAMREVETKVVLPDCALLEALRSRLARLGATHEGDVVEEDVYYQHPCRDFAETDEALRVRRAGGRCELTYKGPKEGGTVKARREETVEVGDCKAIDAILEALGFRKVAVVRKKRSYYRMPGVVVSLDEVEGLGCFAEVEAREGGEATVLEALKLLGLDRYPSTTKSYLELLLEKMGGEG